MFGDFLSVLSFIAEQGDVSPVQPNCSVGSFAAFTVAASDSTDYYPTDRNASDDAYYRTTIDDGGYAGIWGGTGRRGSVSGIQIILIIYLSGILFWCAAIFIPEPFAGIVEVGQERKDGKWNNFSDPSEQNFSF